MAPQAFALFNGEATRGRALAFAARIGEETKTPGRRSPTPSGSRSAARRPTANGPRAWHTGPR